MARARALERAARTRAAAFPAESRGTSGSRAARDRHRVAHQPVVLFRENGASRRRKNRGGCACVRRRPMVFSVRTGHGSGAVRAMDRVRWLPAAQADACADVASGDRHWFYRPTRSACVLEAERYTRRCQSVWVCVRIRIAPQLADVSEPAGVCGARETRPERTAAARHDRPARFHLGTGVGRVLTSSGTSG